MQTRAEREAKKYEEMWEFSDYHIVSPGEKYAYMFDEIMSGRETPAKQLSLVGDEKSNVIDIGCGGGAGGRALEELGYNVLYFDHVHVRPVPEERFLERSLWSKWPKDLTPRWRASTGYCCDVMEHLPTEYVCLAIDRIKEACPQAFFSIGLTDDHLGHLIQQSLHLTVRPYDWWRDLLGEFGTVVDKRDLIQTGVFFVDFKN